jgi:hypothetical protein
VLDVINPDFPEWAAEESCKNLLEMRQRGLDAIPVYHIGEDPKWLQKMLDDLGCEYIGLSATGIGYNRAQEIKFYEDSFKLIPSHIKVHAFGEGSERVLKMFPWASADSTTWMVAGRFGNGRLRFSRFPHLLGNDRDKGMRYAAGLLSGAEYHENIQRDIRRTNPDFTLAFAIGSNGDAYPTLAEVGHAEFLVSYAYIGPGKKGVGKVRQYRSDRAAAIKDKQDILGWFNIVKNKAGLMD